MCFLLKEQKKDPTVNLAAAHCDVLHYSEAGEVRVVGVGLAVAVGDGSLGLWNACGLTITWMTKSFWSLVSCSRVLSVSSFPEKNHRWWAASMSCCVCSCFFSSPMVSAMLALRRRSFPVDSRTWREQIAREGGGQMDDTTMTAVTGNISFDCHILKDAELKAYLHPVLQMVISGLGLVRFLFTRVPGFRNLTKLSGVIR